METKFRWTHPQNFRSQDKAILDASLAIAQREHTDLTNLIRTALREYVEQHAEETVPKLDEYIRDPTYKALPPITKILTPSELKEWSNDSLLLVARHLRSRKMELDAEIRKRGFLEFRW